MVRRLRKTKKNQKYDYNRNRKRLSQKDRQNGVVKCPEIRRVYNNKKFPARNSYEMGFTYDVNRAISMPSRKRQLKEIAQELNAGSDSEPEEQTPKLARKPRAKQFVADEMAEEAKEFNGIRFRLPRSQVRLITTMIDQYGFNYYDMARDRRNYEQETWRQFRSKARKFLKLTAQCTPYLEKKGWLDCDMDDPSDPRWKEFCTDDES